MAIAEMPLDISTFSRAGGPSAVLGDHTKRVCQNLSFYINVNTGTLALHSPSSPTLGACVGYVALTGLAGAGDQFATPFGGFIALGFTAILQIYFNGSGAVNYGVVASTGAAFPVNAIPLATVTTDAVGRIQSVIDSRSSGLSSVPPLGGRMSELVSDATKRAAFVANYSVPRTYSLGPTMPADVALPCSGFFLGSGTCSIPLSFTRTTPVTYITCSPTNNNTPSLQIQANSVNQLYISPTTAQLSTQVVAATGLAFPVNSLAICEVVTDSVSLIRQINDLRPSYI